MNVEFGLQHSLTGLADFGWRVAVRQLSDETRGNLRFGVFPTNWPELLKPDSPKTEMGEGGPYRWESQPQSKGSAYMSTQTIEQPASNGPTVTGKWTWEKIVGILTLLATVVGIAVTVTLWAIDNAGKERETQVTLTLSEHSPSYINAKGLTSLTLSNSSVHRSALVTAAKFTIRDPKELAIVNKHYPQPRPQTFSSGAACQVLCQSAVSVDDVDFTRGAWNDDASFSFWMYRKLKLMPDGIGEVRCGILDANLATERHWFKGSVEIYYHDTRAARDELSEVLTKDGVLFYARAK